MVEVTRVLRGYLGVIGVLNEEAEAGVSRVDFNTGEVFGIARSLFETLCDKGTEAEGRLSRSAFN